MHRITPRNFCLSTVALACAMATATAGATTLLKTDATWTVTAAAPAGTWNSTVGLDTSSWQAATVLYDVAFYLGPNYTAQGIWSSGGQFSTTETSFWARQVFRLDALPTSAALKSGFDDDADLWINGVQVISDHNGLANNVDVADVLPYLKLGDNLVAYTATDNWQTYGYNHSSWVQIDGQTAAIPEPQTYALMLAGLVAIGSMLRRRSRG